MLVRSFAKTFGTTGIELEALTAVSVSIHFFGKVKVVPFFVNHLKKYTLVIQFSLIPNNAICREKSFSGSGSDSVRHVQSGIIGDGDL